MGSNDDLYAGMKMFQEGLRSMNINRATEEATKKVADINANIKDETEKTAALQNIGQDFAMRLGGLGAEPGQIQAMTGGLVQSASGKAANTAQAGMQGVGIEADTAKQKAQHAHELKLQGMKLDALDLKSGAKEGEKYTKFAQTFRKENKDLLDSRDKVQALYKVLDKTPDRVGVEMAKTGLLKFAGEDRISDADINRAQVDPSWRATVLRRINVEATGEALASERGFYKEILKHADTLINDNISNKVSGYSKGVAELDGSDGDRLEKGLRSQLMLKDREAAQAPPPGTIKAKLQSAEQWIADPKNANHPDRTAVQKKIDALKKAK